MQASTGSNLQQIKLTCEPVPLTTATLSLGNLLPSSRWEKIRKETYAKYNYRCCICGIDPSVEPIVKSKFVDEERKQEIKWLRKRRLECHEEWEYNETESVQRLSDLLSLCSRCHQVKHWGWASQGRRGYDLWDDGEKFMRHVKCNAEAGIVFLEEHFMDVNGCDLQILKEHVRQAGDLWIKRSRFVWAIDFGEYDHLIDKDVLRNCLSERKTKLKERAKQRAIRRIANIQVSEWRWRAIPQEVRVSLCSTLGKGSVVNQSIGEIVETLSSRNLEDLEYQLIRHFLEQR